MFPDPVDLDPNRVSRAASAIPGAWLALVKRWDPILLDVLAHEVMQRTGLWPDAEMVHDFLASLDTPSHLETMRTSETHPGIGGPSIYPPSRRGDGSAGF
jgi:hypothetical protein